MTWWTGSQRLGIATILMFFVIGMILLLPLKEPHDGARARWRPRRAARCSRSGTPTTRSSISSGCCGGHGIEAVADVRSRPYSRFVPHFSKERLARLLGQEGLGYLFLGAELGGKPRQEEPPLGHSTTRRACADPRSAGHRGLLPAAPSGASR